jgi:hypothetical protein
MFDFLQTRTNVIPEETSAEASADKDPPTAPDGASDAGATTQTSRNEHPASSEAAAHTENNINREALTALNVKVVCDLAQLLPDKANYEVTRGEAIGMALSIRNGPYRYFAVDHVVGLCRRMCPELRHPGLVIPRSS